MGNDGGSIPTRRELVKSGPRPLTTTELKEALQNAQIYAWTTCPLSQRPLSAPVVSDASGKLYNKDAVLEVLIGSLDERAMKEAQDVLNGNVKGLKDVVEVKFTSADASPGKATNGDSERWICPVTSKPLGAGSKSVYVVPCGHAFSASALRETAKEGDKERSCLVCNEKYADEDVISINPVDEKEVERLKDRLRNLREKGLTHSLKKAAGEKGSKKRKKALDDGEALPKEDKANGKAEKVPSKAATSTIKNAATASLTAKVLEHEQERSKKRKLEMNDNVKSLFSSGSSGKKGNSGDFMTRGYSIPADARRS